MATSSDRSARPGGGRARRPAGSVRHVAITAALLAALVVAPSAAGKVFLTVEDALELAYPGCAYEKRTVFLTEEQIAAAEKTAGVPVDGAVVHPYTVRCDGELTGYAYLDTHRVRTLAETLLIALDADARVRRIEILSFREPEEYIPRDVWYEQFTDRRLDERLALKRDIRGVTGATLTAHATTDAVRRVMALHAVINAGDDG